MRYIIALWAVCGLLFGITVTASGLPARLAQKAGVTTPAEKPTVLVFEADWCFYCKKLKKETLGDPAVKAALAAYNVVYVDADKSPLVGKYKTDAYPTFVLLEGDKEKKRGVGFHTPAEFLEWLRS